MEHYFDPIAAIFGLIQTAFYLDFAWVYWTRQRVKLRNGGVVDSEDLSRGWLVSRMLGRGHDSIDDEEGNAQGGAQGGATKPGRAKWGARGVSVSADDEFADPGQGRKKRMQPSDLGPRDDELAHILEEGADDADHEGVLSPGSQPKGVNDEISNGSEWRDGSK